MRRSSLAALALLLPAALGALADLRPTDDGDEVLAPRGAFPHRETAVRALELAADLEAEHYVVLGPPPSGAEGADPTAGAPRVLGVARRSSRSERDAVCVEFELHLFDSATRVQHSERYSVLEGPRLVYREVRDRAGRTVLLEWDEDLGALRSTEYTGARDAHRKQVAGQGGVLLWLWCMEEVRAGLELSGELPIFDPIAGRVDPVRAETSWFLLHWIPIRRVTWERPDGTLAAEFIACNDRILAWRRQRGGAVLRRIGAAEYELTLDWGRERGEVPGAVTVSLRGGAGEGG